MTQNVLVGSIAQGYLIEVVLLHELVEDVGTQHHCLRNTDLSTRKLVEVGMCLHDIVEERQATSLASERAFTYACEV